MCLVENVSTVFVTSPRPETSFSGLVWHPLQGLEKGKMGMGKRRVLWAGNGL